MTIHPLSAGSGVAVVSDDGQLLRPEGTQCYFPAPDNVQGARPLPPDKHPDISGALSETVDISIPPQLVKSAGFDHLGFGEVNVQVEYCALPIDVVNNCNSTGPTNIYDSSRYTVQQGRMSFHRLCRALNLKIEHDNIYCQAVAHEIPRCRW